MPWTDISFSEQESMNDGFNKVLHININYKEKKGQSPSNATKDGETKRDKSQSNATKDGETKKKKTQANSRGFGRLTPLFVVFGFF